MRVDDLLQDCYRAADAVAIKAIEEEAGYRLPPGYCTFLRYFNGARTGPLFRFSVNDAARTLIHDVLFLRADSTESDEADGDSVLHVYRHYNDPLPDGNLAIGRGCSTNDWLVLSCEESDFGHVYLQIEGELRWVATSIWDFVFGFDVTPSLAFDVETNLELKAIEQGVYLASPIAPPSVTDANGKDTLMCAVQNKQPSLVERLLDLNADLNNRDRHGRTAIFYAVMSHYVDGLRLLRAYPKTPAARQVIQAQAKWSRAT